MTVRTTEGDLNPAFFKGDNRAPCAAVAELPGGALACAKPAGHGSPHAWAGLDGAPSGGLPPRASGAERTATATAARYSGRGRGGARQRSVHDLCGEPAKGAPLLCALEPGHRGKHSWAGVGFGRRTR